MKEKLLRKLLFITFISVNLFASAANQGDTLTLSGRKFKLISTNLITNPGFESGYTGWTDGTTAQATLTATNFSNPSTGGVANSKYLVGLINDTPTGAGSIGTSWPIVSGKSYLFAFQVKFLTSTTAAATATYLKTSLTNDKATESKLILDGVPVSGAGAWTQNFVYFTNSTPAYSYIMSRFRWLSDLYGLDDFMLFEASELAPTGVLQTVINQAQALYNSASNGAAALQTAITTAQGFMTSTNAPAVTLAITNLRTAIQTYQYANASPAAPLDMTGMIVNPGFDTNTATGWNTAGTLNYTEVEFYEKPFNMYQSIKGLPAGVYRLKAQGFERPKSNDGGAAYKAGTETIYSRLYAQTPNYSEVNMPFNSIYKISYSGSTSSNGYINDMASAQSVFTANSANYNMTLPNILLNKGDSLIIGAKLSFTQTGIWSLFDNFRLEYLGAATVNDSVIALTKRIAEAQTILAQRISTTTTNGLNAAITQALAATTATPPVPADVKAAKSVLDAAVTTGYTSLNSYANLQKAMTTAKLILTFLDVSTQITTLQNGINTAQLSYDNLDLTLAQINSATTTLKAVTRSVGKQIYTPSSMGNINDPTNDWCIDRSKQSKNWVLFWEASFGNDQPGSAVDSCLALAERCYRYYTDSLKFIAPGKSKTDTYKMYISFINSTTWIASGSGVDNMIGSLNLTPWALTSRNGQTIAHEVGHCFQYQVHCDNNDQNGWMYGYGANASGENGWWEQCAQWQAFKVMPTIQFTSEWMAGYFTTVNKHILHETPRYNNFFIQDYWCYKHGKDMIGQLWNKSIKPEDPVETYQRLTGITQSQFNDEMWDCAARFATWDIPVLKPYGAPVIGSRPLPKMNNMGSYVWRIDSTVCLENYGHNIIKLNAPSSAKTVTAYFQGLAGTKGFRMNYLASSGWRYGFVALLSNGTRVYGDMKSASMTDNGGAGSVSFNCPAGCTNLWFVVSGAPAVHWRHAWDDDDSNDEQWPYQMAFNNTNYYGYVNNFISAVDNSYAENINLVTKEHTLFIKDISSSGATVKIYTVLGKCMLDMKVNGTSFSANLPAGVFIVTVSTGQSTFKRKILIQ